MSSFNRIGTTWAGACDGLLIQILRDEWGFRGQVMTDFYKGEAQARGHMYMEKEKMIRNGGDTMLATVDEAWEDTASATAVSALRNACHNTFYALANSNAVNDIPPGSIVSKTLAPWQIGLIIGWVVVGLLIAGGIVWIVLRVLDEKKHPEKYKRKEKI